MFTINEDNSIYATRGDVVFFAVKAKDAETGQQFTFEVGDILRMTVYGKKDATNVVLQKDFAVAEESEFVTIFLDGKDTKFEDLISKPKDYWYEIELNPDAHPQTIIGYGEDGPVLFKLFPEGDEVEPDTEITEEDIPVVDAELNVSSNRPIENQAVARAILALEGRCEAGIVHVVDGKIDRTYDKIRQWCESGIPVIVLNKGEHPAFAVNWSDERINFDSGGYMKVADDFGLIRFRFVKYVLLPDNTFHDKSEMYDLEYTNRYF